jgi:hypothetical protein
VPRFGADRWRLAEDFRKFSEGGHALLNYDIVFDMALRASREFLAGMANQSLGVALQRCVAVAQTKSKKAAGRIALGAPVRGQREQPLARPRRRATQLAATRLPVNCRFGGTAGLRRGKRPVSPIAVTELPDLTGSSQSEAVLHSLAEPNVC